MNFTHSDLLHLLSTLKTQGNINIQSFDSKSAAFSVATRCSRLGTLVRFWMPICSVIANLAQKFDDGILWNTESATAELDRFGLAVLDPSVHGFGWTRAYSLTSDMARRFQAFYVPGGG